jgi:hypothetical protein
LLSAFVSYPAQWRHPDRILFLAKLRVVIFTFMRIKLSQD